MQEEQLKNVVFLLLVLGWLYNLDQKMLKHI